MPKISVEIGIERRDISNTLIAKLDAISVVHSPYSGFQATVDQVNHINDRAGRAVAFPHLAARNFFTEDELIDGLEQMGRIKQYLITGGWSNHGHVFKHADELRNFLVTELGIIKNLHCVVNPILESYQHVKKTKYKKYDWGFNRPCINPRLMRKFKTQTVHCLPSAGIADVVKQQLDEVGTFGTFRGIWFDQTRKYIKDQVRFNTVAFWKDIGLPNNDVHLFDYGCLEMTVDDLRRCMFR